MPDLTIDDYKLPANAKASANVPQGQMVEAAFEGLSPWFTGIINKILAVWKIGVTPKDNKVATEVRLGKLAGEANTVKDLVLDYANKELRAKPPLDINAFKIPKEATADSSNTADVMINKAFEALQPWFESIYRLMKPYYVKCGKSGLSDIELQTRLGGVAGQVNVMKDLLVRFVNKEMQRKQEGKSFSAGAGDGDGDDGFTAEQISHVLEEFLDVDVGDNDDVAIPNDDDVTLDLSDES